jgi:hypothetical protein
VESFTKLDSAGKIPALLASIRLGWKLMPVTHTIAYYDAKVIIEKIFIGQAIGELKKDVRLRPWEKF